jgi:hypothetical protein
MSRLNLAVAISFVLATVALGFKSLASGMRSKSALKMVVLDPETMPGE